MKLTFTKMHGLGNDFVVIDSIRQSVPLTKNLIVEWGNRHTGIGFDQLLLVEPAKSDDTDFYYRIFNADGNEVGQCGNGARCLARFLYEEKLTDKNIINIETENGKLTLQKTDGDQYIVDMGQPNFNPKLIPFITNTPSSKGIKYFLEIDGRHIGFFALSVGNPHCVIQVTDVTTAPVQELGSLLTKYNSFPEGTNVEFMQIISPKKIKLRVYERGVGETMACGSGACASVVAGCAADILDQDVDVELVGGHLNVKWENNSVYLTGPATNVFKGTIHL